MKRTLLAIAALTALLTALDQLYRWLHPEVNLARATLVGLTAFAALAALARLHAIRIPVRRGALAIFASAFLSVLAIEAGALVSRTPASAAVHVAILATVYAALEAWSRRRRQTPAQAAAPSRLAESPSAPGVGRAGTSPANATRTMRPLV